MLSKLFFPHTCKYKLSLCITNNKYNVIYSRTLNKITDSVTSADSEMTSTQTKKNMFTFCSLSAHCAKRRNNLLTLHCGWKKNMFTFCSLSAHCAKRRNNLLTFHCGKRTCLLSAHFAKRRNNLLTLHCGKRTSSLSTVKKPIYTKKNVFTFCSKETNLFTFQNKEIIS